MSLIFCSRPVAIVTGSLRGIGRECALKLGKAGFNILLNDRDIDDNYGVTQDIRDELCDCGADSIPFLSDVADVALHATMLEAAINRWGRIDCLLNNAGIPSRRRGDILDVEPDTFDECISVNTRAVFFLSQAVARYMLSQDDRHDKHRSIINITSSNVKAVSITRSEYCVSKAACSMTTKLFALRLASAGIGVYEVRPGIIATEMTRPVKVLYDKMIGDHRVPAERWGYPADVASTVVCMAEGRLLYTVGQAIEVDGGLVMSRY